MTLCITVVSPLKPISGWGRLNRARRLAIVALALALPAAALVGWLVSGTSRALQESAAQVHRENAIAFTLHTLDPSTSRTGGALHVEAISSPGIFADAVAAGGRLYLAGPSGLSVYDSNGSKLADYHVGLELPPAPLVALAAVATSGSGWLKPGSTPAIVVATTGEGFLLYDGTGFTQIRPEDPAARDVTSVLSVPTGRILIGTRKRGVLVWDGRRLEVFHPSLAGLKVTALAGDETDLWVGTLDQGVLHWHAGVLDHFSEPEGLPDPQVTSLALDSDAAYAGTPMGAAEFRDGKLSRKLAEGFFIRSLLATADALWVGTIDEGVLKVALHPGPLARPRPLPSLNEPLSGTVEKILWNGGNLYALTAHALYALDSLTGGWQQALAAGDGLLADGNVSALAFDASGRLWVGYFDRGLDIVDEGGDGRARHVENDRVFCVNRVVPKPDGDLVAVGTANGLVLFNSGGAEEQVLGREQGLIADDVTDVVFRRDGMAVATPAGITLIDSAGVRSLYAFQGLVNNHVYTLAGAGDELLAGTLGGLSVLEGGMVRASYTTANSGLRHNWINAVVAADDGWFVGTYGAGVLRLDSAGNWSSFPDLAGPIQVNPNAMLVTSSHVYAGTLASGLLVYDRSSGRWNDVRDGLPSANVTALAQRNDWIYAGTDNGLVRFHERGLIAP